MQIYVEFDFDSLKDIFLKEFIEIEGEEEKDKHAGYNLVGYGNVL